MVVGLVNGAVLIFSGNMATDRTQKSTILKPADKKKLPVTELFFSESPSSGDFTLYVTTSEEILNYPKIKVQDFKSKTVLEENKNRMASASCVTPGGKLVVGNNEGIAFFNADSREKFENSKIFQGSRRHLVWHNGFLISVTYSDRDGDSVTVFDMTNKLIAYSNRNFAPISHVLTQWGLIFFVTNDKKLNLFQLTEKDLQAKLDILFNKNAFGQAAELAQNAECDAEFIMEIKQMHGDHLYHKGNFDAAMAEYLHTIGRHDTEADVGNRDRKRGGTEPSYVIGKFLEAQRIHNLTLYLQTLHEKQVANTDHTTLLLNCYTKLKDHAKLRDFVQRDNLSFDVKSAITVCREAAYYEHALFLAKKHCQHDSYLQIQLEDCSNFTEALAYISSLDNSNAKQFALLYGEKLLRHGIVDEEKEAGTEASDSTANASNELTEQTTRLFIALCTGFVTHVFAPFILG